MARYFQSIVTGRPLQSGGRSFIFEPIEPRGGSWVGVLAVDDESSASILASTPSVWEIDEAKYQELKKKVTTAPTPVVSSPSRSPRLAPQPLVLDAKRAGVLTNSIGAKKPDEKPATPVLASVELMTTSAIPPFEPLLDTPAPKRRKAA